MLAKELAVNEIFSQTAFYIEGAERIDVEIAKTPVSQFSPEQVEQIVTEARFPPPYDSAIIDNIADGALGNTLTMGEYMNQTIFNVIINTLSLAIIFFAVLIVTTLIIGAVNFSIKLPVLRSFDSIAGGSIAMVRGFFFMYMLFTAIPVFMILMGEQISFITDVLNESTASGMFYNNSIVLPFVSGNLTL